MHLAAVFALTLAALGAILWLSLTGHQTPDVFTIVATTGGGYLIGTRAQDVKNQRDQRNNEPPQ